MIITYNIELTPKLTESALLAQIGIVHLEFSVKCTCLSELVQSNVHLKFSECAHHVHFLYTLI